MRTIRKPAEQGYFSSHWRKRSNLVDYIAVRSLKKGGLSEAITLVKSRSTGKQRIVKTVSTKNAPAEKELEILKRIPKGYHLNYMVEYAWTLKRDHLNICLEYCDMGSLGQLLQDHRARQKPFNPAFIWHVLHDLGSALAFLHFGIKNPSDPRARVREGWDTIAHLDVKPDNIFMSSAGKGKYPRIVLGDFGCAVTFSDVQAGRASARKQDAGTPAWYAPEKFWDVVGKENVAYGRPTDIWSVGAVAHTLCLLELAPVQQQVFRSRMDWPCGTGYSRALNEVVSHCVRQDRHLRPHAPELVQSTIRGR